MLTVCNHMQIGAMCDRSSHALVPDCHDSTPYSYNGGLNESSQRIIQARYYTYYDMQRKAYIKLKLCFIVEFDNDVVKLNIGRFILLKGEIVLKIFSTVKGIFF